MEVRGLLRRITFAGIAVALNGSMRAQRIVVKH
jgi:hypothetical protein